MYFTVVYDWPGWTEFRCSIRKALLSKDSNKKKNCQPENHKNAHNGSCIHRVSYSNQASSSFKNKIFLHAFWLRTKKGSWHFPVNVYIPLTYAITIIRIFPGHGVCRAVYLLFSEVTGGPEPTHMAAYPPTYPQPPIMNIYSVCSSI